MLRYLPWTTYHIAQSHSPILRKQVLLEKPLVFINVAMSLDGYIDDASPNRLVLSNGEDLAAVDALRADHDAIMVGANTLRKDNPSLIIHSEKLKERRRQAGLEANPLKVTITSSANLNSSSRFFHSGGLANIVYCPESCAPRLRRDLEGLATIVDFPGTFAKPEFILESLYSQGVKKLMIEGGKKIHYMFLKAGLVDRLRVAIGPFLVQDDMAPRFVGVAASPNNEACRMQLDSIEKLGNMTVINYRRKSL